MGNIKRVLGCDLGGTNLRSGVIELDGPDANVLADTYRKVRTGEELDVQQAVVMNIAVAISNFFEKIDGIGLDVAGPVSNHDVLLMAANIPCLHDKTPIDLKALLENAFKLPVVISNDLEAALAGEVEQGSLKGTKWAMLENIGTGWGGSRLFNGVAVAAEPGHKWLPSGGQQCGCGNVDCVESTLSGGAIQQRIEVLCNTAEIVIPAGMNACAFADQEAKAGTTWAVNLYTQLAREVGEIWGSDLNNCPPIDRIVYMGSFIERAMRIDFFQKEVRRAMIARSKLRAQHAKVTMHEVTAPRHSNGDSYGPLIGAASIWKQQTEKA